MKKRLFILLFTVICLVLSLTSCGGDEVCTHEDANLDGFCDNCTEAMKDSDGGKDEAKEGLALIENGSARFQIVLGSDVDSYLTSSVISLVRQLDMMGIDTKKVDDLQSNITDVEILIGNVQSRGERYVFDGHTLGAKGKMLKVVDSKVIINAGSDEMLLEAFEDFVEDVIGLKSGVESITDAKLYYDQCYTEIQDDYRITEVTIASQDIRDYVIVTDTSKLELRTAAMELQNALYTRAGIWLPIVNPSDNNPEKAIYFRLLDQVCAEGFRIYVKDGCLYFDTEFIKKIHTETASFVTKNITVSSGKVDFPKKLDEKVDVRNLYYKDFGAKGDGITNDFEALYDCHNYANAYGHIVNADKGGKTYYIGKSGDKSITIQTDVNWGDAKFIIDDSNIAPEDVERNTNVFVINSKRTSKYYDSNSDVIKNINAKGGIDAQTTTNIGYAPGKKVMLIVTNNTKKVYIRYGVNENAGSDQQELIIVDAEGNIDPKTYFILDYDMVTSIKEYSVDEEPITIKGGHFTTKANQAPKRYTYYKRGFSINRSNVTIDGMVHAIIGEGETGAPYSGFFSPYLCNDLLVVNCTFQAHKYYMNDDEMPGGVGGNSSMGTYELGGSNSCNLYYKDCNQSNFFNEDGTLNTGRYWGVMGTNYCKNITYDHCTLNRLDAHAGVYNASIINGSKVKNFQLIGGGEIILEDSTIYNSYFLQLRPDYGSTWRGTLSIKNSHLEYSGNSATIIYGQWTNWYFGYQTYMPHTITLDGVTFNPTVKTVYAIQFSNASEDFTLPTIGGGENLNPVIVTEKVIVRNVKDPNITYLPSGSGWLNEVITMDMEEE